MIARLIFFLIIIFLINSRLSKKLVNLINYIKSINYLHHYFKIVFFYLFILIINI